MPGDIILHQTDDAIVVDRSGGIGMGSSSRTDARRLQFTLLNRDRPDSPIAAVILQGVSLYGKAFDACFDVVLKRECTPAQVNTLLEGTGFKLPTGGYGLPLRNDPNVRFLTEKCQNVNAGCHITLVSDAAADKLQQAAHALDECGLIGDLIKDGLQEFAAAMDGKMVMPITQAVPQGASGHSPRQKLLEEGPRQLGAAASPSGTKPVRN